MQASKNQKNKTVWAFLHTAHGNLGSFEWMLNDCGITPRIFHTYEQDIGHLDPAEPDLVILMGGPMGVYEAETHPFLYKEINFVETRLARGKPILGICLGAQIVAKALGASVYKGSSGKEIGWSPITVNEQGMKTPLKYFDRSKCNVTHWHGDTFDLPQGVTPLASSDIYTNQAFSWGKNTMALQFHPEMTHAKLKIWCENRLDDIHAGGKTPEEMRRDTDLYCDTLEAQNRKFFMEWLNEVAPDLVQENQRVLVDAG